MLVIFNDLRLIYSWEVLWFFLLKISLKKVNNPCQKILSLFFLESKFSALHSLMLLILSYTQQIKLNNEYSKDAPQGWGQMVFAIIVSQAVWITLKCKRGRIQPWAVYNTKLPCLLKRKKLKKLLLSFFDLKFKFNSLPHYIESLSRIPARLWRLWHIKSVCESSKLFVSHCALNIVSFYFLFEC